jgi:hypothetical protein
MAFRLGCSHILKEILPGLQYHTQMKLRTD